MATASASDYSKRRVVIVDLVLDYCDLSFADGTCSATRNDGSECYNTYATCQSTGDYVTTNGKTYRFTEAAGPHIRNVSAFRSLISWTPRKATLDMKQGIGGHDQIDLVFQDFEHGDEGVDPYRHKRSHTRSSTFWRKLRRRNRHYHGRTLYFRYGYMEADGTLYVDGMTTQRYIIESIAPMRGGQVRVVARDMLKKLDRVRIPAETAAELSVTLALGATSLTLKSGQVSQFKTRDGAWPSVGDGIIIRIEDEIILVEGRSGDQLTSLTRDYAGTTDVAHAADTRVQKGEMWEAVAPATIWKDILTLADIDSARIDSAGAATEVAYLHAGWTGTAYLTKPRSAKVVMRDFLQSFGMHTFWDAVAQTVELRANRPRSYLETTTALSETANTVGTELIPAPQEHMRRTRWTVYFGVTDWSKDITKQDKDKDRAAYTRVERVIDSTAENASAYDDLIDEIVFAYWLVASQTNEAGSLCWRGLNAFIDPPMEATIQLEDKDGAALDVGDVVDLTVDELIDDDGTTLTTEFMLTRREEPKAGDSVVSFGARTTNWDGLWFQFGSTSNSSRFTDTAGLLTDGTTVGPRFP